MLGIGIGNGKTALGLTNIATAALIWFAGHAGYEVEPETAVALVGAVNTIIGIVAKLRRAKLENTTPIIGAFALIGLGVGASGCHMTRVNDTTTTTWGFMTAVSSTEYQEKGDGEVWAYGYGQTPLFSKEENATDMTFRGDGYDWSVGNLRTVDQGGQIDAARILGDLALKAFLAQLTGPAAPAVSALGRAPAESFTPPAIELPGATKGAGHSGHRADDHHHGDHKPPVYHHPDDGGEDHNGDHGGHNVPGHHHGDGKPPVHHGGHQ